MRRSRFLTDFIALYRGKTVAEAKLVAVTAESSLVRKFFSELLGESEHQPQDTCSEKPARVLEAVRDE
jgi:hypothetical protein